MSELKDIAKTLARIEKHFTKCFPVFDEELLNQSDSFKWVASSMGGTLTPLPMSSKISLTSLVGLKEQITAVETNVRLFINNQASNHILLTGPRGCGKSSIIRGIFGKYKNKGLRLIETDCFGLTNLSYLITAIAKRKERFLVYCDDLSFSDGDNFIFNQIKSVIDGSLVTDQNNILFCVTSNRRNIVAERYCDNLSPISEEGDIQPLETIDAKNALADRFGLWVPFYAPTMEEYDVIVEHWLQRFGIAMTPHLQLFARRFSDERGSCNGRIAYQFSVLVAGGLIKE